MNKHILSAILTIMIVAMLSPSKLLSQNFVRTYDASSSISSNNWDIFYDVEVLASGNYICTGYSRGPGPARIDAVVYGPTGQLLLDWRSTSSTLTEYGYSVAPTTDGGFVITGEHIPVGNPVTTGTFTVVRFNAQGTLLWSNVFTSMTADTLVPLAGLDIHQTSDGGFIVAGRGGQYPYTGQNSERDGYIMKLDAQGNRVWDYRVRGATQEEAKGVIATSDGGYLITGMTSSVSAYFEPFVVKLSSTGVEEWSKVYNEAFMPSTFIRAVENSTGQFYIAMGSIASSSNPIGTILTLDANGDSLDLKQYNAGAFSDIKPTTDGGYIISGYTGAGSPGTGSHNLILLKLDAQLNQQWERTWVGTSSYGSLGVAQAPDGGYLIAALNNKTAELIKTDADGNVPFTVVNGMIVGDMNSNCLQDNGEVALPNHLVMVTSANGSYYGVSDLQGNYSITVYDTGAAIINWFPPNQLWTEALCQGNTIAITLVPGDTIDQDFYVEPVDRCSDMAVTVTNPFIRRCFDTHYQVQYCNRGTGSAANSYVDVEIDPYLIVLSASMPYDTPMVGNVYRFQLGTVGIGECGFIDIVAITDCDSTILGQTHCVNAHIYPDSTCILPPPTWDGSCVDVHGECGPNDTILFIIENIGTGNMAVPSNYIIVEDNVMYTNGQFQLNSGQFLPVYIKGNGSTFTLFADQTPGYPGQPFAMKSIEGCGVNDNGTYSTGFVPQYPQDDQGSFVSNLCLDNIGAYDPNDKRVVPLGLGTEGYINATQQLDYTIQFQNTGTDTAFLVVLRDTLPQYLDITTLQLTGSSHAYTFQIIGSNVLEWTFANILLPDSNVNEPASHGYVSFHINQLAGNAVGTEIRNRAGIYFDFNPPVITNYTLNTVTEDFKALFTFIHSPESKIALGLYPNPSNGLINLDFDAKPNSSYEFVIYDLTGARQFAQSLMGTAPYPLQPPLPTGMYIYQLLENGTAVGMGKVVVNR